jgi:hypothetical protein
MSAEGLRGVDSAVTIAAGDVSIQAIELCNGFATIADKCVANSTATGGNMFEAECLYWAIGIAVK